VRSWSGSLRAAGTAVLAVAALGVLTACSRAADAPDTSSSLLRLYEHHASNEEVEASGTVRKVLGTRLTRSGNHEGFIVEVPVPLTSQSLRVKIEDNVDISGSIPLAAGDHVHFRGEYVYDSRGGIVHWTHHDPRMRHEPGFIEVNGKRYS